MKKSLRILLAALLTVALVLLSGCAANQKPAATEAPTEAVTEAPTEAPTEEPTETPTEEPTEAPTEEPTEAPTEEPTEEPAEEPAEEPTEEPAEEEAPAVPETVEAPAEAEEEVKEALEEAAEAPVEEAAEAVKEAVEEAAEETAEAAEEGKEAVEEAIEEAAEETPEAAGEIAEAAEAVEEAIEEQAEESAEALEKAVEEVTETAETVEEAVEEKVEAAEEAAQEMAEEVTEAVAAAAAGVAAEVTEAADEAGETVDEAAEETTEAAEEAAEETAEAAEEAVEEEMPDFTGTTLIVFNWYDYIDPETITLFEEATGAKVEYVNFTTNEEMYTKLEAGAANYDVIFPSDYMIERMIANDMLEELDTDNMPHLAGLRSWLRNPDYDPEEKYSVPYMSGTLGILYNTTMVEGEINSWDVLFDEKYAGNIIMINSQRDTIAVALKKLGYSLNSREESELMAARDLLVDQKSRGIPSGYLLDETKDKMVGGEAALAVVYSGDALYAMDKNEDLDYCVPEEGSNVWVDGMCIPKGSKNKACAEAFIDFMCREDIAAMNTDYIRYVPVIQSVADSLEETETERTYAVIAPSDEVIGRCEFFHDIMDVMDLYEQVWMDVRLAK